MTRLSFTEINSFVGDIFPIRLISDSGELCKCDIRWRCTGDSVAIRTFDEGEYAFSDGALIILKQKGVGEVIATLDGVEYRARVTAHDITEKDTELSYFVADLHDHTSLNHNPQEFATQEYGKIEDYLDFVNKEGLYDLTVISDHAEVTNDYLFFRGIALTREGGYNNVITLAGAESEITYTERDRFDILHRMSGEIVTLNSAGYAFTNDFSKLEEELSSSPEPIAIFAHPHVIGYSTNGIWCFDFKRRATPEMLRIIRGIEMGSGDDAKENLLHEYAISAALDAGFRVSTTCSSDAHGPSWSYHDTPGKTIIMARNRSRESFVSALRENRFYASESGNVKLSYTVNSTTAPCDLALTDEYKFHVDLSYFKEDIDSVIKTIMVISDYGKAVFELDTDGASSVDFTIKSETARYFYLRLIDRCGRKTWSPPVFCGREYDGATLDKLTPIDMKKARAYYNGNELSALIDGDPFNSTLFDTPTPEIIIDMGEVRSVSAVGYYPHIILRDTAKGEGWTTSCESANLISHYKIELSSDGVNYTEAYRGVSLNLGIENIARFERTDARFIRFTSLATVGTASRLDNYRSSPARLGNLSVFE